MGNQRDATITIGTEGADSVARDAERALRPWEAYSARAGAAVRSLGGAVADTFKQVASDIGRGITAFAALDLGQQIRSQIEYREAVARTAVVAGQSAASLRDRYAAQEQQILSARDANAKFAASLGRLTYDYQGASKAAGSLGIEAIASGRSLAEMTGIGKTLHSALGSFDGMEEALGRIRAQASQLGTIGGADALRDQIEKLGGAISKLSITSQKDLPKFTALVGGLATGLKPEAAERVQQKLIGAVVDEPVKWERYLRTAGKLKKGETILDERGHVRDPANVLQMMQSAFVERRGLNARRVAQQVFGAEAGAAFMNMDFAGMNAAAPAAPSGEAKAKADAFKATEEGKFTADQLKLRGAQADAAEKVLPASQAFMKFAADHPLAAGLGAMLGPGLASKGIGYVMAKGAGALFGTGASGAAGGAGAAARVATGAGAQVSRAAALEAAAEGGWLSPGSAGAGWGAAAGAGGLAALLMYGQYKTLEEIGEDRTIMGGRYLAEHGGLPGMRKGHVKQLARAAASATDERSYMAALPPTLLEAIKQSPELQQVAAGAFGGQIDTATLSEEMKQAVAEAIRETGINITVVNSTGGPVEAIAEQNAGGATGQQ